MALRRKNKDKPFRFEAMWLHSNEYEKVIQ